MAALKAIQYPLIRFEIRSVEDRNASIEAGRLKYKDVDFICVKHIGDRDEKDHEAIPWITSLEEASRRNDERAKPEWVDFVKKSYEKYKTGQEVRPDGFPVKEWPILRPAQVANLHAMGTYTVEQIVSWNESAIAMYGMGARDLQDKAKLWQQSGDQKAEQIAAQKVQINTLTEKLTALTTLVEELKAAESKKKPKD